MIEHSDKDILKNYLNRIHTLDECIMDQFLGRWSYKSFRKKEIITFEGEVQRYLYFVLQGIQRSYYIKGHKEHVIAFTYAPGFTGIPESFMTQMPSRYFLECISDSMCLRLSYHDLQALMVKNRQIETLFRKATEQVLAGFTHRYYELLALTIEERFRAFTARSPQLLNLIPHKYLASYLGIDQTNFSKLLGRIKI